MQAKKMRSGQSAPFKNNRRHYTTALSFIAAVAAWACAMCYLQADNTPQRQPSAPVVTMQEGHQHG